MSTTMLKGIAVAAALSVGALTLATPAEAGRSSRNLAYGALIGLGAAAIISGAHRRNRGYDYGYGYGPGPYYYAPPPVAYAPPPVYRYRPAPWTQAWYDYCSHKYRSFHPPSGTFQPYRGSRRMCR